MGWQSGWVWFAFRNPRMADLESANGTSWVPFYVGQLALNCRSLTACSDLPSQMATSGWVRSRPKSRHMLHPHTNAIGHGASLWYRADLSSHIQHVEHHGVMN